MERQRLPCLRATRCLFPWLLCESHGAAEGCTPVQRPGSCSCERVVLAWHSGAALAAPSVRTFSATQWWQHPFQKRKQRCCASLHPRCLSSEPEAARQKQRCCWVMRNSMPISPVFESKAAIRAGSKCEQPCFRSMRKELDEDESGLHAVGCRWCAQHRGVRSKKLCSQRSCSDEWCMHTRPGIWGCRLLNVDCLLPWPLLAPVVSV